MHGAIALNVRPWAKLPSKQMRAYAALGIGTLALSFAAMFIRWAQAPGVVTGFYRLLFSTVMLAPALLRGLPGNAPRRRWSDLIPPFLSGMCMAVNFALWNTSLAYTSVANASILGQISPLWVCLTAWLIFRERLSKYFWLGLLVIFSGLLLITNAYSLSNPHLGIGDIMAATASFFSAAYVMITQWGRQRLDALTYVWLNGASATAWTFVITLALKYPLVGFPPRTWLIFAVAAVITQVIGYLAISFALGHLPAAVVSPTLNLQPVVTIILAIPLLRESPTFLEGAGCVLALGGVLIINRSYQQRTIPASPIDTE